MRLPAQIERLQSRFVSAFAAIVLASLLSRLGYQMARSPVLPAFAIAQARVGGCA
jgi:hypothetical protein